MQILPNGLVRIKNLETGETKDVTPGELPTYGGDALLETYTKIKDTTPNNPLVKSGSTNNINPVTSSGSGFSEADYKASLEHDIKFNGGKNRASLEQLYKANNPEGKTPNVLNTPMPTIKNGATNSDQARFQEAYKNAATIDDQNKIADAWRKSHNYELFSVEPSALTGEDKKKQDSLKASLNFINKLEQRFQAGGAGESNLGPLTRISGMGKSFAATIGLNDELNTYKRQKAGFAATLKTLTGDTGVLTDQDYARLAGLLPGTSSTRKESENLFNDLRQQMAAKFGGETTKTSFNSKEKNIGQVLLPEVTKFAEGRIAEQERLRELAKTKPEQANKEVMEQSKAFLSNMSPFGFVKNLATGQKEAHSLVAPTAELVGDIMLADAGISLTKGVMSMVKGQGTGGLANFTSKGASASREAAAKQSTQKFSGDELLKNADKYAANDPTAANLLEKIRPTLAGKNITAEQLLDKLAIYNKGYSAAGKVGASSKAGLYDALSKGTRQLLKDQAPEIYAAQRALAGALMREGIAKKIFNPVTIGSTIVGTGIGMGIYSGLKKN